MSILLKIHIIFAREEAEIKKIFTNPETVDYNINIQYLPFIVLFILILRYKRDF